MRHPESLSPDEVPAPVAAVLRALMATGKQAWVVGGAVRDLIRGLPPSETADDFEVG